MDEPIMDEPKAPRRPSERTRKVARGLVGGMRTWRQLVDSAGNRLRKFLPNLLPGNEVNTPSSTLTMIAIAVIVPVLVVTVGATIYFTYGRSIQYDRNMIEAENARARAISAGEPIRERTEWQAVLFHLREAENQNTPELEPQKRAQNELDPWKAFSLNFPRSLPGSGRRSAGWPPTRPTCICWMRSWGASCMLPRWGAASS
jgi:hypothetical protein